MQDKQTILLLNRRKIFCLNKNCTHKTFTERFDFVAPNGKKTKRLIDKILITSTKLSEYYDAMKSQFRQAGNHLTETGKSSIISASLLA